MVWVCGTGDDAGVGVSCVHSRSRNAYALTIHHADYYLVRLSYSSDASASAEPTAAYCHCWTALTNTIPSPDSVSYKYEVRLEASAGQFPKAIHLAKEGTQAYPLHENNSDQCLYDGPYRSYLRSC